jgi:hypothetical protein
MIPRFFILSLLCCFTVSSATESLPTDPRSLYNHGAELASSGKLDEAAEVLRQTAVVRDKTIAAKALALLGQIAAANAKQNVSENPTETPVELRQTIFDLLKSAEQSFTESLSLQPNEKTRHNLETIRAWRYNMANIWEEHDREQLRNSELQQRIRLLADWEEKLIEKVQPMLEEPNSPRKFQAGYESGREQKKFAEELTMLPDMPDDEELIEKWVHLPEIQRIAEEAAGLLVNHRPIEALPKQQQVLDYLRSLLKQEDNQQDQDQEQNDQEQQEQEQEQGQDQQSQQQDQQPQSSEQQESAGAQQREEVPQETPMERAERLLMQVRRKEQTAEQQRELFRVLQMQAEAVEKDW